MRNIDIRKTFILTAIFGIILIPSFLAALAKEEGTIGTNTIWIGFDKLYSIFRFPTHTLFEQLIMKSGKAIFFSGLVFNCLFYGIVTERIIYNVKGLRKQHLEEKSSS